MSFAVVRVALPLLPAASVCAATMATVPTGIAVALIAAALQPPAVQTGGGVTAMPPTLTLTGNPLSEQVPVTPL